MAAISRSLASMVWPAVFVASMAWIIWFFPRFIVTAGYANDNLNSQYQGAGVIDFLFLGLTLVALVLGSRQAKPTHGEVEIRTPLDKLSLFLGRASMLLIVVLVSVMFFEVVMRYVFVRPTLWANEMSLWMAGFIFLFAGLYAMQQRTHIRIFLLYDIMPRNLQRASDTLSSLLILVFSLAMIWGSFNEARDKFLRWETFGTAFDPPIPATMKPMVLIVILLVALQAIANLIADWHREAEQHDMVDEAEIEEVAQTIRAQEQSTGKN